MYVCVRVCVCACVRTCVWCMCGVCLNRDAINVPCGLVQDMFDV